jgi:glycerol-3-phosphate acyltransferase PlsX
VAHRLLEESITQRIAADLARLGTETLRAPHKIVSEVAR